MKTGVIKSYWSGRGFGFIKTDDGTSDVFMHAKAFMHPESEPEILQEKELVGIRVRYAARPREKGMIATIVQRD